MSKTISSTYASGITLTSTASNPVTVTGTISVTTGTALYGKPGSSNSWTINNSGKIVSKGTAGVFLGTYTTSIASGTLTNSGYIYGKQYGVFISGPAVVTNAAGGTIAAGAENGIQIYLAKGTVVNAGVVLGGSAGYGLYEQSGGSVTNLATGTIIGHQGVRLGGTDGTLINAGTIEAQSASGTAVTMNQGERLIVDPGAVFFGKVIGGGGGSILELASAVSAGTLTATNFSGFSTIAFDANAQWTFAGNSTALAGIISGFTTGDTIDLTGFYAVSATYAGGNLTLTNTASAHTTLHFSGGPFATGTPHITTNASGTVLTDVQCYAKGTRIATERGDVPVEALREGDRVYSQLSGHYEPIRWIGRRHLDCARQPDPRRVWPVRIGAGAFGPRLPLRDLYLSPNHAVFVGEVLIPVRLLINGSSIVQVPIDEITYYHVELPAHDVLLAEGMPAESYLDIGDRACFDTAGSLIRQFPDFAAHSGNVVQRWEALGCAPLVVYGRQLHAVRRWVNELANAMTHAGAKVA